MFITSTEIPCHPSQ